jgi:hypothetical protein
MEFRCRNCRKPIDQKKRISTQYCGVECRREVEMIKRKTVALERRNQQIVIVETHRHWLYKFEKEVRENAPENAIGYQAGLWVGEGFDWFPRLPEGTNAKGARRARLTLLRTKTVDDFFLICPFEPPAIPIVTSYRIRYKSRYYPHPVLDAAEQDWYADIPYAVYCPGKQYDPSRLPIKR